MRITFPLLLVVLLSACGGGGGSSPGLSLDPPADSQHQGDAAQQPSTDVDNDEPQAVVLAWAKPTERENGEYLEEHEIGGYGLRYRLPDETDHEHIIISDGSTVRWEVPLGSTAYDFEIATFDSDGLYSEYVSLPGRRQVL